MIEVSIQERYSHDRGSHITDVPTVTGVLMIELSIQESFHMIE